MITFSEFIRKNPMLPVLRGIKPEQAKAVGALLVDAGFCALEVTLNSPNPYESIAILAKEYGDRAIIGAGTVTDPSQVAKVKAAGGQLIVMPHSDHAVITAAKNQGLACIPGTFTPTEMFAALALGADALKIFPAIIAQPAGIKAVRAVLPKETVIFATGGVNLDNMENFMKAGSTGLGLGGELFRPTDTLDQTRENAAQFIACAKAIGLMA